MSVAHLIAIGSLTLLVDRNVVTALAAKLCPDNDAYVDEEHDGRYHRIWHVSITVAGLPESETSVDDTEND